MHPDPTRREILKTAVVVGAAGLISPLSATADPQATRPAEPPRAFRFAHLTDIHVEPERDAAKGFAAALDAVEALKPRPDFILTGGDLVFDVLEVPPQRAHELFALYKRVIADHTSIPVRNTVGNHDVLGWIASNGVTPKTPGYGKDMVKDKLSLERTYYRFDHKGWRFFVLDNIQPRGNQEGYQGYLDPEQRDWFEAELKATNPKTPIVISEHIPTLTVTHLWSESYWKNGVCETSNSLICSDGPRRLRMIQDRNVRLWLSGHIHQRDRIEYRGTTFINDGAVSGAWWKGAHQGVPEGFGVIDAWADGTFTHEYKTFGWLAKA